MRKVFLDDLPKWESGMNKGRVNFEKSIGYKVKGIYNDINFEVEIVDYTKEKPSKLKIKYNDVIFEIITNYFSQCQIGKLLGIFEKPIPNFKYNINKTFNENTRNIKIIDREYRKIINKQGYQCNEKWYKYHCNKCGYEDWTREGYLRDGNGCSCCCSGSKTVVEGINDIPTTAPWMIQYFQGGYDEAKLYSKSSQKKIYPVCPDCSKIKDKSMIINNIYKYRSTACSCSDKISYPNKFMYNLLKQLNIYFKREYNPIWIKPKVYDFYVPSMNLIIEMDGGFHFKDNDMNGQTVKETISIDNYKDKIARLHNIEVIRIDCNYDLIENRFAYIKQNILKSRLVELFNLSNICWDKVEEFALSNLVKVACEYKRNNPDMTTVDIGEKLNLERSSIIKYLKIGTKLGWCNYNPKEESSKATLKRFIKPLICLETMIISNTTKESALIHNNKLGLNFKSNSIQRVCVGGRKTYKGYHFKYIKDLTTEEYIKYDIENKLKDINVSEIIHNAQEMKILYSELQEKEKNIHSKKIICITTKKVFNRVIDGTTYYNASSKNIGTCLSGSRKSCGKLEDGTKLQWKYISDLTPEEYIEYDIDNKLKELHNQELVQAI